MPWSPTWPTRIGCRCGRGVVVAPNKGDSPNKEKDYPWVIKHGLLEQLIHLQIKRDDFPTIVSFKQIASEC